MKQPLVVVNKAGGAGGEGFLDVKGSAGNHYSWLLLSPICSQLRSGPAFHSVTRI
jgi:tripartite-type tricarboxylate transporter receptor subunit TctC